MNTAEVWKALIVCGSGTLPECKFEHLILLIRNGIQDLVIIATFLTVAVFAWAGIKLMASGGNESAKTEATKMLTKVVIGYLWILGAWVIVYTISRILLKPAFFFTP